MRRTSLVLLVGFAAFLAVHTSTAQTSIPNWQPNTAFSAGALVMFNNVEFKCLQPHTSQVGWEPPNAPALWQQVNATPAPTPSPTPTATPAPTPPKPTPTPTPTPSPTPKPTPTPTPSPSPTPTPGGSCFAPWSASQTYTAGLKASLNGINYTANFWNMNQSPATNNGGSGSGQPWTSNGSCLTPTPTPTPSPTPNPAPTPTPSPSPAPSPTPTPTPGPGPTITCSAAPWNSATSYSGGSQVTFGGFTWQAKFFTQNNQPVVDENGVWEIRGICGQLPGPNPNRTAAPYVDVTLPLFNTITSAPQPPVKFLTLAFVIAQNGCAASWAGAMPIPAPGTTPPLMDAINTYRANHGDIGISFGGAAGQELALSCANVNSLVTQYQNVISQYHPKFIDFDLESSATNDAMREQAIAILQGNNPGLQVSYTLQTEPNGINSLATTILQDAVAAGVNIGVVNVMSMDLGGAFDHGGQMGLDAQLSGWSVQDTLQVMFPNKSRAQVAAMVGVTVMIGTNDNLAEIFQIADINTLVQTALDNGWGRIAFWSVTRDQDCRTVPGIGVVTPQPASGECSGVVQNQFQYSTGFNIFNP